MRTKAPWGDVMKVRISGSAGHEVEIEASDKDGVDFQDLLAFTRGLWEDTHPAEDRLGPAFGYIVERAR